MPRLTPEEKAYRKRQRMLKTAKEYQLGTYTAKFVAPEFQLMIRAEAGAEPVGMAPAVVKGEFTQVYRDVGECVCVTCGKVLPWSARKGAMQAGHFLQSRRNSILFEEENVAPQCVWCNKIRGGAEGDYRLWMTEVRGAETVERLQRLKATTRQFTREELVDMRLEYAPRLREAKKRMTHF